MAKFCMTGVTSCRNRGVEALVRTTVEGVRGRYPEAGFTLFSEAPAFDAIRLGDLHLSVKPDLFSGAGMATKLRYRLASNALLGPARSGEIKAALEALADSEALIVSGGDLFGPIYPQWPTYLRWVYLAKQVGTPVVFMGQSIGLFKKPADIQRFTAAIERATLITARDRVTLRHTVDDLNIPESKVKLTADSAFLLQPTGEEESRRVATRLGLKPGVPTLAVSISEYIARWGKIDKQRHFATWLNLLQSVLERTDAQVLIVPHVQDGGANDDLIVSTRMMKELGWPERVCLAAGDFTAGDFKGLVGLTDLMIAERMHASIAAFSGGVPAVLVSYSIKARGLTQLMYGEGESSDAAIIDLEQWNDGDGAWRFFERAWGRRDELKAQVAAALPGMKRSAALNYEYLAAALGQPPASRPESV